MKKLLFILLFLPLFAFSQYSYWYIAKDGVFSDTVCLKNLTDSLFRKNNTTFTFIGKVFAKPFAGAVLPLGGTVNQILKKTSTDLDYTWAPIDAVGGLAAANNLSDVANIITARTNLGLVIGTDVLAPTGSAAALTSFPTFNQNTTGSAASWTTGRTIAITGDLAYTSPDINGTANATAAGTLATVNGNVGSFGSATQTGTFTVNGKGLITAASNTTIAIPESAVTSLVSDLALKAPLASPAFTGTPTGITATHVGLGNVTNESKATMFTSPAFTSVPTSPTAATGTNTTQIATTAFTEAAVPNASYRVISEASGSHIAGRVAGTYALGDGDPIAISGTGTLYPIKIIHIASADLPTVDGKTTKLKIKVNIAVNDVAPTGNYTFGLYPITRPATSGGAGLDIYTLGTVVASSTVLFTTPAADGLLTGSSSDISLPSDGFYCIGVITTATVAVSSHLHMTAYLMMRNN